MHARVKTLPVAVAIGFPTALLAHVLAFGRQHVVAGSAHEIVVQAAVAVTALLAISAFGFSLPWAARAADGSVLAARLAGNLPRWPTLAAATGGWFALIESLEPMHASSPALVVAAIAVVAMLVAAIARRLVGLIAIATLVLVTRQFAPREGCRRWRIVRRPLRARPIAARTRPFVRPPPLTA